MWNRYLKIVTFKLLLSGNFLFKKESYAGIKNTELVAEVRVETFEKISQKFQVSFLTQYNPFCQINDQSQLYHWLTRKVGRDFCCFLSAWKMSWDLQTQLPYSQWPQMSLMTMNVISEEGTKKRLLLVPFPFTNNFLFMMLKESLFNFWITTKEVKCHKWQGQSIIWNMLRIQLYKELPRLFERLNKSVSLKIIEEMYLKVFFWKPLQRIFCLDMIASVMSNTFLSISFKLENKQKSHTVRHNE